MAAAARYPDAQAAVQAELDAVVGTDQCSSLRVLHEDLISP